MKRTKFPRKNIKSTYNELHLPMKCKGMFKVGDKYKAPEWAYRNKRYLRFDGLTIQRIEYGDDIKLIFDFVEVIGDKSFL